MYVAGCVYVVEATDEPVDNVLNLLLLEQRLTLLTRVFLYCVETLLDQTSQVRGFLNVLHDKEQVTIIFVALSVFYYTRMVQLRHDLNLVFNEGFFLLRKRLLQNDLHRCLRFGRPLRKQKYCPVCSFTQHRVCGLILLSDLA